MAKYFRSRLIYFHEPENKKIKSLRVKVPFGLCKVPSVFHWLMKGVLSGCQDCSVVYIDNVLVYSDLTHLRRVFSAIRDHGLTCKPCQFGMSRLLYQSKGPQTCLSLPAPPLASSYLRTARRLQRWAEDINIL